MDLVYFIVILGDRAQALCKFLQVKKSKSEFLEEFMLEGLRFSSSMYLCLIWLRIFWYVLKIPKDVKKRLNPMLTSFGDFFNNPTRDNYVEGLLNDMSKLPITPKKQYTARRKLSKLVDSDGSDLDLPYVPPPVSSDDEDEIPQSPKKKKCKKQKKSKMLKY